MSESQFTSGPWTGFYNYVPGDRHRMDLNLEFANGFLSGNGTDDIGPFLIRGRYEAAAGECHWQKHYVGAHVVYYRGFREGKGIWGTWEINAWNHGGFHIWPQGSGQAEAEAREQGEPAEAVGEEVQTTVAHGEESR